VCNVDDVIKMKPETVWYFAYWQARDVPSGAEVAIVGCCLPGRLCGSVRTDTLVLTEIRKIKLKFCLGRTLKKNFPGPSRQTYSHCVNVIPDKKLHNK